MCDSSSCFQSSLRSLAQELSEEYSAHAALPHRSNGLTTVLQGQPLQVALDVAAKRLGKAIIADIGLV